MRHGRQGDLWSGGRGRLTRFRISLQKEGCDGDKTEQRGGRAEWEGNGLMGRVHFLTSDL